MASQMIDRYEVKTKLGQGGMASVYHAYDPRFKRDVAIKVLPREFLHDGTFRARFEREAQTIATLEHSAIVSVYDFGEHDGQPFLVMQYMPGGSLADRIKRGPLQVGETATIISRIASALDAAHGRGLIHRDIKPANILFDAFGEARLADFGIVRLSEGPSQLTGTGIVGTPSYMAPEMAQENSLSPSIDIYALGVTLFEMLAGQQPYKADTPMGVIMAHISRPIPNILELRPDLPAAVQTVIERSMAKEPADRYGTAGEMGRAMTAASTGAPAEEAMPQTLVVEEVVPSLDEILKTEELPIPSAVDAVTQQMESSASADVVATPDVRVAPERPAKEKKKGRGAGLVIAGAVGMLLLLLCILVVIAGSLTATSPAWVILYAEDGVAYGDTTSDLADKLESLHDDGESIRDLTIGPGDSYVILYGENDFGYANIGTDLEDKLKELRRNGSKIWQVALGPGDGWVVLYDDRSLAFGNVTETLADKLGEIYNSDGVVWYVAIGPGDSWVALYNDDGIAYANIPESLADRLTGLRDDGTPIQQVGLALDGGWLVLYGEDGVAYEGLPQEAADKVAELHDQGAVIWHLALTSGPNAGILGQ